MPDELNIENLGTKSYWIMFLWLYVCEWKLNHTYSVVYIPALQIHSR